MAKKAEQKKRTKRANGEGTIYPYRDGYSAQVIIGRDNEGKAIRKTVYGKSEFEIVQKRNKLLGEAGKPIISTSDYTLGEWIKEWLDVYAKPQMEYSTWQGYEIEYRLHVNPKIGYVLLKDLTHDFLQRFYFLSKNSPAKIQKFHILIRSSLKQAVKNNLIYSNPAIDLIIPKYRKEEIKYYDEAQSDIFLNTAKEDPFYIYFLTAWASGVRRGELLGLKWENITKKSIEIRQTATWTKAGLTIKPPKTKSSRRTVDLPTEVLDQINSLPKYGDFVFARTDGQPIAPKTLEHHFKKIIKLAGLPEIRFHDLRHTHATILLRKGVHPKVVQERLGHSKISTTLDIYSHVIQGMQAEVADILSGMLTKK